MVEELGSLVIHQMRIISNVSDVGAHDILKRHVGIYMDIFRSNLASLLYKVLF